MNEIQRLIHEMCPNGVPMVALISVADVLYGCPFDAKLFTDNDSYIPLIRIRDVVPGIPSTYYSGDYQDLYIIHKGDILVGMDGNFNLEKWKSDRNGVLCQRVCKIESNSKGLVLNNYLYHYLGPLFKLIEESTPGGSVKHLSAKTINQIQIPLPPLPIQQRIVEILDKFTSLVSSLDSEIALRQKQYEYYRNKLLSFEEGDEGVEWKKIIDFADLKAGKAISASELSEIQDETHPYPCFGGNGIRGYIAKKSHSGEYAIIGRQGALCGCVNWATGDFYATEHAVVCTPSRLTDTKYLFYLFENADLNQYKSQGAQPGLAVSNLNELVYPIPPLSVQQRIVRTLDLFESLLTNLKKERELRQKQYEYYREKLLTFA